MVVDRALESYRNASRDLQRPQAEEVARYREWMETHKPIDNSETSFLKHEQDLFVLSSKQFERPTLTAKAAGIPLMLILPFALFPLVSSFPWRILAVTVSGMSQLLLCSVMGIAQVMTTREWIFGTSV
jgi:hypothetical protein